MWVGPAYGEAAKTVGSLLGQNKVGLVYGGTKLALMGVVADAALKLKGEVIGVIPEDFCNKGLAHEGFTELNRALIYLTDLAL